MLENEENANALKKDDLKFETIDFTKESLYTSTESSQQKGTEMLELRRQSHEERLHR